MVDWAGMIGGKTRAAVVDDAIALLRSLGSVITNFNVGGVARTLLELVGQSCSDLYGLLVDVVPQGFPLHATGVWLNEHLKGVGTALQTAQTTQGGVRAYRVDTAGNVLIPKDALVGTLPGADGTVLRFVVRADTTLPEGATDVIVPVEAEVAGSVYNVAPGRITQLLTSIPELDGVTNDEDWISREGTDDETDAAGQERYRLRWATLSRGAIAEAYISWAREVPGVVDVGVHDQAPRGQGTVDVVITGESGQPSAQLVADVLAYIQARIPTCVDLQVSGPPAVPIAVQVRAYLPWTGEGDPETVESALEARYDSLLSTGDVAEFPRLRISQSLYRSRLIEIGMGVSPVVKVEVDAPAGETEVARTERIELSGPVVVTVSRLSQPPSWV